MITTRALPTGYDTREAVALLNRTQGVGLFEDDYVARRLGRDDALALAAFEGERFVGVSVIERIDDFAYHAPFDRGLPAELAGRRVASFTTLAVVEDRQGQGIGRRLCRERLGWARERGFEVVLGVSWVSGLAHTSDRTFEKSGFRAVNRLADFYHDSSLAKPFDCPGCHVIPCTCAAVLYRLDL